MKRTTAHFLAELITINEVRPGGRTLSSGLDGRKLNQCPWRENQLYGILFEFEEDEPIEVK